MTSKKITYRIVIVIFAFPSILFILWKGLIHGLEYGTQGILTFFLLLAMLILPFFFCINKEKNGFKLGFDFFQPGAFFAVFYYSYYILPSILIWYKFEYESPLLKLYSFNYPSYYNYTLLILLLGLLFFGFGYRYKLVRKFVSTPKSKSTFVYRSIKLPNDDIVKITILFLILVGFIARIMILKKIGLNYSDLLQFLSPFTRRARDIRLSGVLIFASSFLDWGAILLLFRAIVKNKSKLYALLFMIVVLISSYLISGKRAYIAQFILFPLVWHHYFWHRINFMRALVYFFIVFILMAGLLLSRITIPLYVQGDFHSRMALSTIEEDPINFYISTPDIHIFDVTVMSVIGKKEILQKAGGWLDAFLYYNFSTISFLVPRFIWEEKPVFHDLGSIIYLLYFGNQSGVGFSVGIFGAFYLFSGLFGLLIGMFLLGRFLEFIYYHFQPLSRDPNSVFAYTIVVWVMFMFFRFGTLSFLLLFIIQYLGVGIVLALTLFRPKNLNKFNKRRTKYV